MEEEKSPVAKRAFGLRRLGRWLLLAAAVLTGALACFLIYVLSAAPDLDQADVSPDGYRSTVLDDDGEVILTLMGEASNRIYVTLDQIPEDLQKAVVAIEDERFYQHHGIDLHGIARAAWRNLTAGRLSEGASTITQQLIKNNVLTGWTQEQTALDRIRRKLQEQYLALEITKNFSKDDVLIRYMNAINLGHNTLGVESASLRYFGKHCSELNLSECAVIASITQNPSKYNPLRHPQENAIRREKCLKKMFLKLLMLFMV